MESIPATRWQKGDKEIDYYYLKGLSNSKSIILNKTKTKTNIINRVPPSAFFFLSSNQAVQHSGLDTTFHLSNYRQTI